MYPEEWNSAFGTENPKQKLKIGETSQLVLDGDIKFHYQHEGF